ncbi:MAG: hypothetical protein E7434_08470 [Ruminococcaceae bacterium]|nr:hypothetical protein [Oscillospiraceae bacterium]
MEQTLPRRDWLILITVFLALGGIGMMVIFSILIGFGFHSVVGKIALYICFALQLLNVITIALRRHNLTHKYHAPPPSRKMRKFLAFQVILWTIGALCLIFSLVCNIFWFEAIDAIVVYPCFIGSIAAPLGWLGMLAGFHRRRQAAILTGCNAAQ